MDPINEFRIAMRAHGLVPPEEIVADGRIHRCDVDARHGQGDGAYLLHLDGVPAGGFQNWQNGGWQDWCSRGSSSLTSAERSALRVAAVSERREREAETKQRQLEAGQRARAIWDAATLANADHEYLKRKGVGIHGLRLYRGDLSIGSVAVDGALIVPIRNAAGELTSLEFITGAGEKRYLAGGQVHGCYFSIGRLDGVIVIAEGFATAASIRAATSHVSVCAFNAGNLEPVAVALREKYADERIIIAADHDQHGVGLKAATAAAQAIGGAVAMPDTAGADWNDVMSASGAEAVLTGINAAHEVSHKARVSRSQPTPLVRELPPAAAYPIDALGPVLSSAARAIAEIVQVPNALAANSVLATAALAVQAQANVWTLGGVRPVSLYILTVAASGERKSSADGVALVPVTEHVRRATVSYEVQRLEHERAVAATKLAKSIARKDAKSPNEYEAALAEIAEEPPPRRPWIICQEPTIEGLLISLRDGQFAQGIYSDEGGQFIGGHALSNDAELRTVSTLSRAWQGDALDRVRAKDAEHLVLYGRRLSIHLLAQPGVAQRLLSKELYRASGFLARWLIAAPGSLVGTRQHDPKQAEPANDQRIRKFWHLIAELLARPPVVDKEVGGLAPSALALSGQAKDLLISAYNEIETGQATGGNLEAMRDWAGKAAEHACRIAGVLTLSADATAVEVSADTMHGALLLTEHYMGEFARLVGAAGVSETMQRAELLREWILKRELTELTARDVMRLGPNSIRSADAAKAALHTLVEHDWLATKDGKTFTRVEKAP